nr:probable methyltransferase At1g27930 [Tanacetum cinerariifolium]
MAFVVDYGKGPNESVIPPPSDLPKCGKTVFLEDEPEKLMKVNDHVNGTQVFRIEYKTSAKEAYKLLKHARTHSSCSLRSGIKSLTSKCKIALTGFPKEVLKTKWDIIVVDGPGGDGPDSPGRMGAIYMAGVLARAGNRTNVVVHDVDRTIEKWFSWEFLSEKNLAESISSSNNLYQMFVVLEFK